MPDTDPRTLADFLDERGEYVPPAMREQQPITPCTELSGAEEDSGWDDDDDGCEGHESLAGAHMGEAVYCDGSCRRVRRV